MNLYNVGKQIKEHRAKKLIKQNDLADALGIKSASLSDIENGINIPTLGLFVKICKELDVPADVLLQDCDAAFLIYSIYDYYRDIDRDKSQELLALMAKLVKGGDCDG